MKIEWPTGLGAVISIVVLILCIVLALIGKLPVLIALLVGLNALARLA